MWMYTCSYLAGGFNPSIKKARQIGSIPSILGLKTKMKLPPSFGSQWLKFFEKKSYNCIISGTIETSWILVIMLYIYYIIIYNIYVHMQGFFKGSNVNSAEPRPSTPMASLKVIRTSGGRRLGHPKRKVVFQPSTLTMYVIKSYWQSYWQMTTCFFWNIVSTSFRSF